MLAFTFGRSAAELANQRLNITDSVSLGATGTESSPTIRPNFRAAQLSCWVRRNCKSGTRSNPLRRGFGHPPRGVPEDRNHLVRPIEIGIVLKHDDVRPRYGGQRPDVLDLTAITISSGTPIDFDKLPFALSAIAPIEVSSHTPVRESIMSQT